MYRLVIWGTGNYYKRYINRFREHDILAVVDNDTQKQGEMIDGKIIVSPEDVKAIDADYYVILCAKYKPIKEQMILLGIADEAIITPTSEGIFKQFRKVYRKGRKERGEVLLLSHAMDMRGAPLMLFELAKIFKNKGILVDVGTSCDGSLEEEYLKNGISILKFDDYDFCSDEIKSYFCEYKHILINTLALNSLVKLFVENNIKVCWWIHEEWSAYKILNVDNGIDVRSDFLRVFCVGDRAKNAFIDFFGESDIEQLQWGIELHASREVNRKNSNDVIIAVIGPLTYIKGQDLFLELRDKDEWMLNNRIKVWFIGDAEEKEKQRYTQIEWIEIKGEYNHNQLLELYDELDVVLSTSRNDTMPVSLIEGLMKRKLVISSDGTGVSDYITSGVDGVVYKRNNPLELWSAIEWAVNSKSKWSEMQENGFELYRRRFSVENFEKQIERLFAI